ncbi:hypothetical protein [Leisingera methylohalidivorans]|uniref:Phage head morphogenesis domain-containing protein n=1 Tax=Leisingera methylohalidivorans DSM 14336 TaxID=999552 RepID=V9VW20_9RHOB|nr:hypothetical protein [Leisingera methylohalidivorans]AHD02946.1 hypothetical protein METH_06860 [Leisingera methylohalidivorans DSM 14336]
MASQRQALIEALRKLEPGIRRAFEDAIQRASSAISLKQVIELMEANRFEDLVRLLRIDQSVLYPLTEALRGGYIVGGNLGSAVAPKSLIGYFGFNGRHERAEAWLTQNGARFIQGITEESTQTVRTAVQAGIQQGRSSRAVAAELIGRRVGSRRVGGYLGLTAQQADSIISGRSKLASGDPVQMREYLGLKLRDKRFDRTILKASREGRSITGKQLDQIMEAHRSKALRYRAKVVAKFEAREALAAGREEAMVQLLDRPDVEEVTARWQHNLSKEPRPDHVTMSGTVITLGQGFQFPDGTRMKRPHDQNGPLRHRIGCNCMAIYRLKLRRHG